MARDATRKRAEDVSDRTAQPADANTLAPSSMSSSIVASEPVPQTPEADPSDSSTSSSPTGPTSPASQTEEIAAVSLIAESADEPSILSEPPDPFDPQRLRLSQDFAADLGVKKAMLTLLVRKPSKEWWFRTHPGNEYRIETAVLELKEDREVYLVAPELWGELSTESTFSARALFTAVNRQGVPFIWPVRLPGPDGKLDEWSTSALEAATMAMNGWVRMAANMSLGAYDVWETTAPLPEPQWPPLPFKDLLRIAFKDKFIDRLDHPVLRKLRGEA
mgnify:FL=1